MWLVMTLLNAFLDFFFGEISRTAEHSVEIIRKFRQYPYHVHAPIVLSKLQ